MILPRWIQWLWQQMKKHRFLTGAIIVAFIVLAFVVWGWNQNWTGFNGGFSQVTTTSTSHGVTTTTVQPPRKTLWDLLQLLIIPAVLASAGFGFSYNERKASERRADTEREIALDNQRQETLQAYFDNISELLLHANLRKSSPKGEAGKSELHLDEVNIIARVRTSTVLSELDGRRKGHLINFLYEAGLINDNLESVIFLYDADLSGIDLKKANLNNAYLPATNLSGANLNEAVLNTAILGGADLSKAQLGKATLIKTQLGMATQWINTGPGFFHARTKKTKLCDADLSEANLTDANLSDADLSRANLSGANLDRANLKGATGITNQELEKQAKSLKGATMPDGSIHP